MCFGVRDAIAQAEQLAEQAPLTILGELVHNPIVRERLRAQGVAGGITRSTASEIRAGDDYRALEHQMQSAQSGASTDFTLSMERVLSFGTRMNN